MSRSLFLATVVLLILGPWARELVWCQSGQAAEAETFRLQSPAAPRAELTSPHVLRLPPVWSRVRHASHLEAAASIPQETSVSRVSRPEADSADEATSLAPQPESSIPPGSRELTADDLAPGILESASQSRPTGRLEGSFEGERPAGGVGVDFYSSGVFENAIGIPGTRAAIKISGYVKVDLIYDFDPIDSTDLFDTTTIPVHAQPRTNTRFHARQSRLNFDVRWPTQLGPARAFCEADFFSEGDRWRLRHAYGELGGLTIGQTWTTFTNMASLPTTLDFEGAVSSINRRQAQVRWTQPIWSEGLSASIALEDPRVIVEVPDGVEGDPRTPTPDLIARVRLSRDWGQLQAAGLWRKIGFQPRDRSVLSEDAWGLNFTGALEPTRRDKVYFQILFGDGIGSYKGLPDVAPASAVTATTLPVFAWMIGWTHQWNDRFSSNFTFSENRLDNAGFQEEDDLHRDTYLAVNLIWSPAERVFCGVEYLFGTREDVNGDRGEANRLQAAVFFYLP